MCLKRTKIKKKRAGLAHFLKYAKLIRLGYELLVRVESASAWVGYSVTRMDNFLLFGQTFKASGNNYFTQIDQIVSHFLWWCQNHSLFYWNYFWTTLIDIWQFFPGHTGRLAPPFKFDLIWFIFHFFRHRRKRGMFPTTSVTRLGYFSRLLADKPKYLVAFGLNWKHISKYCCVKIWKKLGYFLIQQLVTLPMTVNDQSLVFDPNFREIRSKIDSWVFGTLDTFLFFK